MGSDWLKNKRKQEPIGLELNFYNSVLAGPGVKAHGVAT